MYKMLTFKIPLQRQSVLGLTSSFKIKWIIKPN